MPDENCIECNSLADGRVSWVLIKSPNSCNFQISCNIHNNEFVGRGLAIVCSSIKADFDLCATDPWNSNLLICRDVNIATNSSTEARTGESRYPILERLLSDG